MLLKTSDICSTSDFRKDIKAHLDRLSLNGGAEVLTVNGEAKGVVMAPATFDKLARKAAWQDHLDAVDRGMREALAGTGKPARGALKDMKARLKLELEG